MTNTCLHMNLMFHHMGVVMRETTLLLREATNMAGRPYRPVTRMELHLGDLVMSEMPRQTLADHAKDEEECGSHSDPDQADPGDKATSD